MTTTNLVWHYTVNNSMSGILQDGEIKPADIYVDTSKERPITWFSKDPFWERTVFKGFRTSAGIVDLDMGGMLAHGIRLFRIGVRCSVAPHNWTALRLLSGMDSRIANGLVRSAKERGANPQDWFGSFESVTSDKWESIEEFLNGKWTSFATKAERAA
jgi:hypothetical protein